MGTAPSKATPVPTKAPSFQEKTLRREAELISQTETQLEALNLDEAPVSVDGSLRQGNFDEWEGIASQDPRTKLARSVLEHLDVAGAIVSRSAKIADTHVFNTTVPFKTNPTTNQRSSGRCWLFATTNVLRHDIMSKLNLTNFQLSQSYLFFWDKMEKANYFLELSLDHVDLPVDSRLLTHLYKDPVGDGGQWDMACNLLERYGVVPQAVYPESYSSSSSGRINRLITSSLRQHSLGLRKLSAQLHASFAAAGLNEEASALAVRAALRKKKEHCLGDTWRILCATMGVPPSAKQEFTWDYYDADHKAQSWTGSARQFYKEFSSKKYPPTDSFSLINDPRNAYSELYTVDKLGNVWGGREVRYVNTSTDRLKAAVVKVIQAGQPVFFGCDVGQLSDTPSGIMDTKLFDYQEAFGIALTMDKTARLQSGDSAMTHAMVITGVHLDGDGNPVRYRVENSWGDAVGDKGYFVMTDRWFDEFVYQVVVPKALAPKDLVEVYEGGNPTVYPPWDPMGTLA